MPLCRKPACYNIYDYCVTRRTGHTKWDCNPSPCALLGTRGGLEARGDLQFAEEELAPFRVQGEDSAGLQRRLLPRLMDVPMRSVVAHLFRLAHRLAVAALIILGVHPTAPSWYLGKWDAVSKVDDHDKWAQAVSERSAEAFEAMQLVHSTGMMSMKRASACC